MTHAELNERARTIKRQSDAADKHLNHLVRGLEPALRDAGLHNTADRLLAAIDEVDRMAREREEFFTAHAQEIAAMMMGVGPPW